MTPLLYYALFLALGLAVSFEDWTRKKIRNRLIAAGLLACAAGLCWFLANSVLGYRHAQFLGAGEFYLPWPYYPKLLLHLSLSLTAAVTLWRLSVWPAGDAKFFTVCVFFVALIDPNLPGFPSLLFLLLLINIFVPAGLVFAAETVLKAAWKLPDLRRVDWPTWRKAQANWAEVRLKEVWPYRWQYLILVINLFALFFALQTLQMRFMRLLPGLWAPLLVFLALSAGWSIVVGLLRNQTVGLLALAGVAAWTLSDVFGGDWDAAARLAAAGRMTLNFGMFLSLGRMLFGWFIERDSLRELEPDQLRLGVVLSDGTWARLSQEKDLAMERRCVDGLSQKDAEALKSWLAGRGGGGGYTVYQTIPFALWIFLGTLLTLSGRGSVVAVLAPRLELLRSAAARWLS